MKKPVKRSRILDIKKEALVCGASFFTTRFLTIPFHGLWCFAFQLIAES
jgi:hypothetical protein